MRHGKRELGHGNWAEWTLARPTRFLCLVSALALPFAGCATEAETDSPSRSDEVTASRTEDPTRVRAVALEVETPDGMVGVPGGTTTIGVLEGEGGMAHERPAFEAEVAPFFLDRSPVTVGRFRAFVEEMEFETLAEGFGDGAVMDQGTGQWGLVSGANWKTPFGPGLEAADDHPVTQVAYSDAEAFCAWDGGRLPTEIEWEHAARGADNDRSSYAWGDALEDESGPRANTWTGSFPGNDDGSDGFAGGTNPIGQFGETTLGLTDLGGNVWEWTSSWYRSYADRDVPYTPTVQSQRVQRGGSYLCNASYCHGYRVSARSHATPESSFAHVGFRCARTL